MKKILKQILITLTVVVFTGCGTGDERSSSGGNGKLIKVNDLLPEAAKNVLLKTVRVTETDGTFYESEFFYEKNKLRMTYSANGSLLYENTYEDIGDGLITTHRNINPEYEAELISKYKYKNKRLDTITDTYTDVVGIKKSDPKYKTKKVVSKVLKRKGSMITEYVKKRYNDDKNLLETHEHKHEVDKLKIIREDTTITYSKHAKKAAGETHKSYTTNEYDDTLNTINPGSYGDEKTYVNNAPGGVYMPSKMTYHDDQGGTFSQSTTFEFDSNGLMTKQIRGDSVITYKYIDKN